jgi:hypothetical protein
MRLHQLGADRGGEDRPSIDEYRRRPETLSGALQFGRGTGGRALAFLRSAVGNWTWGQGSEWPGRTLGRPSHSSGRLSDRPWIVIVVVVDDARAMTLGTGDDVAVLILDPALAMALRTDFHAACPVPSRQHRSFETPVPHRQSRLASAPPPRKLSSSFESHRSGRTGSFSRIARHVDQRRVSAGVVCTPSSRMLPSVIAGRVVLGVHSMTSSARSSNASGILSPSALRS